MTVRTVPPVGGAYAVAAFAGRKRIGQLTWGQFSRDEPCPIVEIWVLPEYQRRGLGRALIQAAHQRCLRMFRRPLSSSGIVSDQLDALFRQMEQRGEAAWDDSVGWHGEYVVQLPPKR